MSLYYLGIWFLEHSKTQLTVNHLLLFPGRDYEELTSFIRQTFNTRLGYIVRPYLNQKKKKRKERKKAGGILLS
jgi:hypothetical protein